ncbi:hypothetical protein MSG28_007258 [Choristoneura fumiferana]|uniref:Uncharacterized protein n=1 Tax=Choristoneura fumiferana TaxID=7141 RepID=A0ACC0JWR2_CHOFU|nr:hypothetical protein MSG28_007258 [Choristoneura fumiferana]
MERKSQSLNLNFSLLFITNFSYKLTYVAKCLPSSVRQLSARGLSAEVPDVSCREAVHDTDLECTDASESNLTYISFLPKLSKPNKSKTHYIASVDHHWLEFGKA